MCSSPSSEKLRTIVKSNSQHVWGDLQWLIISYQFLTNYQIDELPTCNYVPCATQFMSFDVSRVASLKAKFQIPPNLQKLNRFSSCTNSRTLRFNICAGLSFKLSLLAQRTQKDTKGGVLFSTSVSWTAKISFASPHRDGRRATTHALNTRRKFQVALTVYTAWVNDPRDIVHLRLYTAVWSKLSAAEGLKKKVYKLSCGQQGPASLTGLWHAKNDMRYLIAASQLYWPVRS